MALDQLAAAGSSLSYGGEPQLRGSPPGAGRTTLVLTGPTLPLQFPSLHHFDDRVATLVQRAQAVRNLTPATCAWVLKAARSFRTSLKEMRSEKRFLGGDVRQQVEALQDWIVWMRTRGMSPVAINTYWRGVRLLFRWMQEADGVVNPMLFIASPRFGRVLPQYLTKEAAGALLGFVRTHAWGSDFARARNLAIVGLMLLAGLRRGEVAKLALADVDPTRRTIRVRGGKGRFGGKDRTCYMPPQLAEILLDYIAHRAKARLTHPAFVSSVRFDRPATAETVRRVCDDISRLSGIRVRPHALRHTYATLLRLSGVPDRVAMDLLGHSSYAMLQRYSHVFNGEHLKEAAKLNLTSD